MIPIDDGDHQRHEEHKERLSLCVLRVLCVFVVAVKDTDERWMERALALAARGLGETNPNPVVGCVVVKGRRVVGEGFHRRAGGPHAEVVALRQAGARARGATLYVNARACAHARADATLRAAGRGLRRRARGGGRDRPEPARGRPRAAPAALARDRGHDRRAARPGARS